jgi:hypothetical protein
VYIPHVHSTAIGGVIRAYTETDVESRIVVDLLHAEHEHITSIKCADGTERIAKSVVCGWREEF